MKINLAVDSLEHAVIKTGICATAIGKTKLK